VFAGDFSQSVTAVASYTADLTKSLSSGDTLADVSWNSAPTGLTVVPAIPEFTGKVVGIWVSGGVPGAYQVNGVAYTVGGAQIPVCFNFLITPGSFMGNNSGARTATAAGNFQMQPGDNIIYVNPNPAGTVNIVPPARPIVGKPYTVKDIGNGGQGIAATYPIKITPASGLIDGVATLTLAENLAFVSFNWDGTNFWTVG
jgi:hypothetical protein